MGGSGGFGRDKFLVATVTANVTVYLTITDFSAGDVLTLANKGTETLSRTKLVLGSTAGFAVASGIAPSLIGA